MVFSVSRKKVPDGYEFSWSRNFICGDQSEMTIGAGDKTEVRHVVSTGLDNGPHQMRLEVKPEAVALIREIRVYRPPLREMR